MGENRERSRLWRATAEHRKIDHAGIPVHTKVTVTRMSVPVQFKAKGKEARRKVTGEREAQEMKGLKNIK